MNDQFEKFSQAYDEDFYEIAVNELKSGQFSEALWSKALAKSDFDETKAKGIYVDLRVEQLKSDIALEQAILDSEEEAKLIDAENKKLEKELVKLENEALVQNVLSSPLLLVQFFIIAGTIGYIQESWIIGIIVFFFLVILMTIPYISNVMGFLMACSFGILGLMLGSEWWGESGGYWAGGLTFLIVLGANKELIDKNKETRNIRKMEE